MYSLRSYRVTPNHETLCYCCLVVLLKIGRKCFLTHLMSQIEQIAFIEIQCQNNLACLLACSSPSIFDDDAPLQTVQSLCVGKATGTAGVTSTKLYRIMRISADNYTAVFNAACYSNVQISLGKRNESSNKLMQLGMNKACAHKATIMPMLLDAETSAIFRVKYHCVCIRPTCTTRKLCSIGLYSFCAECDTCTLCIRRTVCVGQTPALMLE